ncbi:hypothetical protein [Terribacillus saccharophilus]|uniref:hypothetical protein n=1 Tax=Terribacillus saccharophilus TaxID=361277 RepID=UPI002DD1D229|nr:hypothetical protein [Terribacillus saccharophilus]MEC0288801.1 hypothetical protein [Terribacillus saccharophilus]
MAIGKTIKLDSGIVVEDAYIQVFSLSGNKANLEITVDIYVSRAASISKPSVERRFYNFTPDQDDVSIRWDKQAYRYIKTLPEYEGAVDILEENQRLV